ncbi:MAG: integrase arm-type DNA-binding domain-containing protein [Rickettsiales bacterium]|nr:integrase arm-type DNA-binding domain-containing protein [Rickettsiales bacterium]
MLTAKQIENAEIKDKPYKLFDSDGLYVLIRSKKSKYLRYKYRFQNKEKLYALGVWGELSLSDARKKRDEVKVLLKQGIDPNQHKKQSELAATIAADNTFEAIAREWHKLNTKRWTEGHASKILRRLELHLFPAIGQRPITEIKTPEVLHLIRQVEKRGTTEVTKRISQLANSTFTYAIQTGRAEYNPAQALRGALEPHEVEHYPTIHADELPKFFRDLKSSSSSNLTKLAMKITMHTLLRPAELRKSQWDYIDYENKQWCIPAELMKMKRPHTVPLSSQVLELLDQAKAQSDGGPYIFPSQARTKNPMMSEAAVTNMLKTMDYHGIMSWHGCRALGSTTLREIGNFDDLVVEKQLAHKDQNQSRSPYNRAEYINQRAAMMQWWSNFLEKAERQTA